MQETADQQNLYFIRTVQFQNFLDIAIIFWCPGLSRPEIKFTLVGIKCVSTFVGLFNADQSFCHDVASSKYWYLCTIM